eukprot:4793038-Pleurochrysis_carterae.AAC.4
MRALIRVSISLAARAPGRPSEVSPADCTVESAGGPNVDLPTSRARRWRLQFNELARFRQYNCHRALAVRPHQA